MRGRWLGWALLVGTVVLMLPVVPYGIQQAAFLPTALAALFMGSPAAISIWTAE